MAGEMTLAKLLVRLQSEGEGQLKQDLRAIEKALDGVDKAGSNATEAIRQVNAENKKFIEGTKRAQKEAKERAKQEIADAKAVAKEHDAKVKSITDGAKRLAKAAKEQSAQEKRDIADAVRAEKDHAKAIEQTIKMYERMAGVKLKPVFSSADIKNATAALKEHARELERISGVQYTLEKVKKGSGFGGLSFMGMTGAVAFATGLVNVFTGLFKTLLAGFKKIASVAMTSLNFIGKHIMETGKTMLTLAMNAVETENLYEVAMEGMADSTRKWSVDMSRSLRLNQYEVRNNVALFNLWFKSMGFGAEQANKMGKSLTQATYDIASLRNLRFEDVLVRIQSGIVGITRPLGRLGILVHEQEIKQEALRQGWIKEGQELTALQKVYARIHLILKGAKLDYGDMENTLGKLKNTIRTFWQRLHQLGTVWGMELIPGAEKFMEIVHRGLAFFEKIDFGAVVAKARAAIIKFWDENEERIGYIRDKVVDLIATIATGFLKLPSIFASIFKIVVDTFQRIEKLITRMEELSAPAMDPVKEFAKDTAAYAMKRDGYSKAFIPYSAEQMTSHPQYNSGQPAKEELSTEDTSKEIVSMMDSVRTVIKEFIESLYVKEYRPKPPKPPGPGPWPAGEGAGEDEGAKPFWSGIADVWKNAMLGAFKDRKEQLLEKIEKNTRLPGRYKPELPRLLKEPTKFDITKKPLVEQKFVDDLNAMLPKSLHKLATEGWGRSATDNIQAVGPSIKRVGLDMPSSLFDEVNRFASELSPVKAVNRANQFISKPTVSEQKKLDKVVANTAGTKSEVTAIGANIVTAINNIQIAPAFI